MAWQNATRMKHVQLAKLTQAAGNPLLWDIPKSGILASIQLAINVTIAGTLSGLNALGGQAIIKKIRLIANSGIDLINISGTGYFSLLKNFIDDYRLITPTKSNATAVISATSFHLPIFLPIAINARDPIGLIMLQNEQTALQLSVELESATNLATGASYSAYDVTPLLEIFTVPVKQEDWPPFNVVQQVIEDQQSVAATGDYTYQVPRGNTYLQILHGLGLAQAGADNWSAAKLILNQSDTLYNYTPDLFDNVYDRLVGRDRLPGVVAFDFTGTSAMGMLGSVRDVLYSGLVTDLKSVITASATGTLFTVRRQLVTLGG